MAPDEPEVLLTTAEVAKWFKVDPSTVRRWIADGQLDAVETPGRNYRISADEVRRRLNPSDRPAA